MGKTKFERILDSALASIELSSSSSSKFDRLLAMLASHWRVDPTAVGVKALAAAKNYGNRISEATRAPIEFLVLLAETGVTVEAVARALETRALKSVPTILAVRENRGAWVVEAIFLPVDADNPFDIDVPVRMLAHRGVNAIEPSDLERLRTGILQLAGKCAETDLEAFLSELSAEPHTMLLKRVTDVKNLRNRISEAVGQRPDFLLVHLPRELVGAARRILQNHILTFPLMNPFLLIEGSDGLLVEQVPLVDKSCPPQASFQNELFVGQEGSEGSGAQVTGPSSVHEVSEGQPLQYRLLERVKQLNRLLPFDSDGKHLYEERQESSDRLAYETKALGYVQRLLTQQERLIIVLTGNAGHGKTHLCRRMLEADDANTEVMTGLCDDQLGERKWLVEGAGLPVRIIKDLSEINPPEVAANLLETLLQQVEAHVIVCANEGRLRDVVSRNFSALKDLTEALERGLEGGETCAPGRPDVHVLNLNHQAATAGNGGFLGHALDHFLNHESAWKVCRSCCAQEHCPILANRNELSRSPASPPENARRRKALGELVRLAEEGGYVLTFREVLEFVAYLVTGRLSCADVERHHRSRKLCELAAHRVLPLLFESQLSDDNSETLPLLIRLRRLDPGLVALRPIDDAIHANLEENGMLGSGLFGDTGRHLHLRADLEHEETQHREIVRRARRRAWFDAQTGTDYGERLGLHFHKVFRSLQGDPPVSDLLKALRLLVRGLHTIQGAIGVDATSTFHIVDPAFGRSGSHAAVIARSVRIRDMELMTESKWWRLNHPEGAPPILDSVEWIDRRLVLVESREKKTVLIALDLLAFEFVMSAGNGIVMREFHSAERRRILRTLARLAESARGTSDEIRVLVGRGEGQLIIERDDTISLERRV